jgi:beta-barrel assembly-enhancing protease
MRSIALFLCVLMADARSPGDPKAKPPCPEITHASRGINFYSRGREIALGKDLALDLERASRMIEDPIVCEYVNRIGQTLAWHSDAPFFPVIRIIRSDDPNSLALPGGLVYIHSGLIRAANNEAELAVALAHELGHVAARHYTRQASLSDILGAATIPLMFMGGWPSLLAQEGMSAAGTPLILKKFSRGAETEADRLGIRYLYEAGYDPTAFVDFMERISLQSQMNRGTFAILISAHPAISSRIRAAQRQIQKELRPRPEYLLQTSEFDLIKQRLAAIEHGSIVPKKPVISPVPAGERPVLRRAP